MRRISSRAHTGFRPNRRAHDAIAEIHHLASSPGKYHWVLETDIQAIKDKVKAKTYRSTRHMDLEELITSMNRALAGWAAYFRYGVSKAVFSTIGAFAWGRLMRWIRAKYKDRHRPGMKQLRRRFCDQGWRFACNGVVFTGASSVAVTRYRFRLGGQLLGIHIRQRGVVRVLVQV